MDEQPIKRSRSEWDAFFMAFARDVAQLSKDPNRKVGAVLVAPDRRQLSIGYNGLPADMPDLPSLLSDKEAKQEHMVHAEDNCLRQAPFPAKGCTVYVTRFPCLECASKLREAGVARVVAPRPDLGHGRWGKSWSVATAVLLSSNVRVTYMETPE